MLVNIAPSWAVKGRELAQMRDKFWRDVIAQRCHQKQLHVKVQYQVSVPISCDICTPLPRTLSHILIIQYL